MQRQKAIARWLETSTDLNDFKLTLASFDASFRRYFRVTSAAKSYIVMDAPPAKESLEPFASLSTQFRASGINTPKIYARDDKQGFLLLTDFGNTSYLDVLKQENVDSLYRQAMDVIVKLQKIDRNTLNLPLYDDNLLIAEMMLFQQWYLEKFTKVKLSKAQEKTLRKIFRLLSETALSQAQVCVHRDFHSRNLMHLDQDNPGVIDFQDAACGPITYDLVSLIKDCYIDWAEEQLTSWIAYFHNQLTDKTLSLEQFERDLDFMGVQRHLKASGIFARLYIRDGKPGYINDIPRTLDYINKMADKYSELKALKDFCVFDREFFVV